MAPAAARQGIGRRRSTPSSSARGESELALDDLSAHDRSLAPQSQMRLAMANVYTDLGLGAQALAQWNLWIRGEVHLRLGQAAFGEADLGEARQAQPDIDAEIRRRGLPLAEETAR